MVNNKKNRGREDYKPSNIEPYWQKIWGEKEIYSPNLDKAQNPFYNLMMFPYPSAEGMHVGNMYAFTGADVYGRFMRMSGYDVFEPIGLDGFGIHSENYAIKIGRHPKEQAKISEKNFYRQLRATGNGFDWSRKVETYDPSYYKWTQWLFIQLFKAGLAYRAKAKVNWCPSCKTVLADEQVVSKKLEVRNGKLERGAGSEKDGRTSHFANPASHLAPLTSIAVCERCSTEVYKKDLEQWFFRITKYADELLAGLAKLDWSEKVKIAQKQWIGKKTGINITYKVADSNEEIVCFTTTPVNFAATFIVLSPEHPLTLKITNKERLNEVKEYVYKAKSEKEAERIAEGREKTGVFTGAYCLNHVTREKIPIWVSDFVLIDVGSGAIQGCPGHDMRDFEFAKKFRIPIKRVVVGVDGDTSEITKSEQVIESGAIGKMINSDFLDGMEFSYAMQKTMDYFEKKGWGKRVATYHLRDWLISRQRYWGPPIPMIYCEVCAKKGNSGFTLTKKSAFADALVSQTDLLEDRLDNLRGNITQKLRFVKGVDLPGVEPGRPGLSSRSSKPAKPTPESVYKSDELVNDWNSAGWFPIEEKDLPVLLPDVKDWKPTGIHSTSSGQAVKSPLATVESFVNTTCPNCKSPAKRETDVSDNFLDSAWYFFRYVSTDIDNSPFDIKRAKKWLPVKMYIGGAEHSALHLLYSRFITMVLHDLGYISFQEPFSRFFAHGLLIKEKAKMSKSKGNVVVPDEYIRKFGADTLRMYLMFLGPFSQGGDFYDTALEGMYRFVRRVWTLFAQSQKSIQRFAQDKSQKLDEERLRIMHKTIKKVTEDISNLRYNTAIAAMMEWHNYLKLKINPSTSSGQKSQVTIGEAETFLKLLAPFAPHMTEELWQQLKVSKDRKVSEVSNGGRAPFDTFGTSGTFDTFSSIHLQPWPKYDPKFLEEDEVTIVVQVDGKVRDTMGVKSSTLRLRSGQELKVKSYVEELARKSQRVSKYLEGKQVKKVVYVEGKVINFVTD